MSQTSPDNSNAEHRDSPSDQEMDTDTVKTAGRGFLIITAAKVWFLLTSAVIQLGLPILFGSPEQFGIFKIVTEWVGWINMVMITGTLHAVSKLISEQPQRARVIVNMAIKMQCLLAVPIAGLYALGSPLIAEHWYDAADTLTPLMQLSALIILFYGFYAIFVGYFNGLKQFPRQATLDFTFSTVKLIGIVGLVLLGFGVWGAVAGFVGAAGVIFVIAAVWVIRRMRRRTDQTEPEDKDEAKKAFRRLLSYLVLIMLYTFALNGLMRIDLLVLPGVAGDVPSHLVGMEDLFELMSNTFAGLYGAVLNIARIPYQGVIAVTFIIFPLISESTFEEDRERTQEYIRSTLRYCIIMIGVGAMLLAFNADAIVGGLYAEVYGHAALALAVLSVAIIFFALLYVTTTMIIGSGHPKVAFGIMAASLGISGVLNYVFVRRVHEETVADFEPVSAPTFEGEQAPQVVAGAVDAASARADFAWPWIVESTNYLQSASIATLIAMFTGFVLSLLWLWYKFGAQPPWMTLLRIGLVGVVLWGIDMLVDLPVEMVIDHGNLAFLAMVVAKMTVMGIVALAVLIAGREFTQTDWERLKAVISRDDGDDDENDEDSEDGEDGEDGDIDADAPGAGR